MIAPRFEVNDGINDEAVKLAVAVRVRGDEVRFDFWCLAAQPGNSKYFPHTHVIAVVYFYLKAMVDRNSSIDESQYCPMETMEVEIPVRGFARGARKCSVVSGSGGTVILASAVQPELQDNASTLSPLVQARCAQLAGLINERGAHSWQRH